MVTDCADNRRGGTSVGGEEAASMGGVTFAIGARDLSLHVTVEAAVPLDQEGGMAADGAPPLFRVDPPILFRWVAPS
jgi:hypothetical protein